MASIDTVHSRAAKTETGSGSLTAAFGPAVRGSDVGQALRPGFDHCAEVVPFPGALLLEILPDLDEVLARDRFVEQPSLCARMCRGVGLQRA
ncbi:hypothetical protein [Luteimonas abyssi]|uniref:hypothetical protein n=1 Tax=Luteimonas abyssi TaxID=1247514 RepID=UPI0012FCBFFA|nr:hypothetical protein [Luteimonas abyssi]